MANPQSGYLVPTDFAIKALNQRPPRSDFIDWIPVDPWRRRAEFPLAIDRDLAALRSVPQRMKEVFQRRRNRRKTQSVWTVAYRTTRTLRR